MDYVKTITTAHSTYTESAPLVTKIKMTIGKITGGFVYFPSGPAGKLHMQAKLGLHQILPFTPGESLALNDCVVPVNINFDITSHPTTVDILTWNESTTYDHTLTVGLFFDPAVRPAKNRNWWKNLINTR